MRLDEKKRACFSSLEPVGSEASTEHYQVDFVILNLGKRLSHSKRQIQWRFGISNPEAWQEGQTGESCREKEHTVSLTWSLGSGKRVIHEDGKEVHFETSKGDTKFEHSWEMRGGKIRAKVVGYSSQRVMEGQHARQFDLFVDGKSYFDMLKVHELGVKKPQRTAVSFSLHTEEIEDVNEDRNDDQTVMTTDSRRSTSSSATIKRFFAEFPPVFSSLKETSIVKKRIRKSKSLPDLQNMSAIETPKNPFSVVTTKGNHNLNLHSASEIDYPGNPFSDLNANEISTHSCPAIVPRGNPFSDLGTEGSQNFNLYSASALDYSGNPFEDLCEKEEHKMPSSPVEDDFTVMSSSTKSDEARNPSEEAPFHEKTVTESEPSDGPTSTRSLQDNSSQTFVSRIRRKSTSDLRSHLKTESKKCIPVFRKVPLHAVLC